MSNLDSRSKRASSAQIVAPWMLTPVLPDGTISQGDRQHIAFSYSGILAAAPPAPPIGEPDILTTATWANREWHHPPVLPPHSAAWGFKRLSLGGIR